MKKLIITLITISLLLTSCSEEKFENVKKYYSTGTVQEGNIDELNSYIGYTDSFNNTDLGAKIGGKIVNISKNVGDKVKVGEVVAILDSSEGKTGYNSSQDIITSLETLKISTSQMFDSQIEVMNQKIFQAKTNIEMADIGINGTQIGTNDTKNSINSSIETLNSQIKTAQVGLETAKINLENTNNSLKSKENDIYNNSKNAISNSNILSSNILDFLDNFFGITDNNRYKNDDFETFISAKDTSLKSQIEDNFRNIQTKINSLKNLPLDNNENIKIALEKYNDLFSNDYRNILKLSYKALENSISSNNFSENTINNYKNQINSLQSQNEQIILNVSGNYFLGLKGSLDSINALEKEKKSTIDMLEKQIELANSQIETLNKSKEQIKLTGNGQITDITTKSEISKKQKELSLNGLNEAKAGLEALKKQKSASLSEIDTKINEVKSGKNTSLVMIENGKVISLSDGIVTKKTAEIGSIVGPGSPIMTISSNDKIKIEIQINSETLKNINIGDKTNVEIENIENFKKGTITKILPTSDQITKKSTIEITIDNKKGDIKLGSYSKVFFDIKSKKTGIIIPNKVIISKYNIPQVFVLETENIPTDITESKYIKANIAKLKTIKIIKQNDDFSQIEGLKIGEIIIIDGKENIFDGERL